MYKDISNSKSVQHLKKKWEKQKCLYSYTVYIKFEYFVDCVLIVLLMFHVLCQKMCLVSGTVSGVCRDSSLEGIQKFVSLQKGQLRPHVGSFNQPQLVVLTSRLFQHLCKQKSYKNTCFYTFLNFRHGQLIFVAFPSSLPQAIHFFYFSFVDCFLAYFHCLGYWPTGPLL